MTGMSSQKGDRGFMADLHVHLPMYVTPARDPTHRLWSYAADRLESALVTHAGRDGDNFVAGSGEPRVSIPQLEQGGVGIALSVLYSAFEEFMPTADLRSLPRRWLTAFRALRRCAPDAPSAGAVGSLALALAAAADPPPQRALSRLLRRLEGVERYVETHHRDRAAFAHDPAELREILAQGRLALVHCVEGGFHLGPNSGSVQQAVRTLARRGVAYITVGHLFYREVATVVPCIPLDERDHELLFPKPREGLTARARAAIAASVREGVLIDVCHLSEAALNETFALLDELDPAGTVPLIASHAATRTGSQTYNLDDETIARVAARGGLIGVILASHQLSDGIPQESGVDLVLRHVDRIADVAGSHLHTAIGSDLGGFIQPADGIPTAAALGTVRAALERRYGAEDAAAIGGGKVLRLLTTAWRR